MPSVSAVVLTRDSERTIEACLTALNSAVDHVVVVDTGSVDTTLQIAKLCGARVYNFKWRNDFAAARNFGDSVSTTDWVIHVDSDEILRSEDTDKIRQVCAKYKRTAVPVVINVLQLNRLGDTVQVNEMSRMYKRGVLVWTGIVHEQPIHKRRQPFYGESVAIGFMHDGYSSDTVNLRDKCMRNIQLLRTGIDQEPNNPAYHYFLGRDSMIVDDYESAIQHLTRCIDLFEHQNLLSKIDYARHLLNQCLEKIGTTSS